jgi:hypothetical protein
VGKPLSLLLPPPVGWLPDVVPPGDAPLPDVVGPDGLPLVVRVLGLKVFPFSSVVIVTVAVSVGKMTVVTVVTNVENTVVGALLIVTTPPLMLTISPADWKNWLYVAW